MTHTKWWICWFILLVACVIPYVWIRMAVATISVVLVVGFTFSESDSEEK